MTDIFYNIYIFIYIYIYIYRARHATGIDVDQHVFNFSIATLSHTEKTVLARGLDVGIPPLGIDKESVFAEFEILQSQLNHHEPRSNDDLLYMEARLAELAHKFANSPINSREFAWSKIHYQAAKLLKANKEIYITKPDKGAGVVILNTNDYTDKMLSILSDTTKFIKLGDVSIDNTLSTEVKLQKRFLQLHRKKFIDKDTYDKIRPCGFSTTQNVWAT